MDVKEAIEKCNLYIQAGATINVVDKVDGKMAFVTYDTTAIETVLSELEKKDEIVKSIIQRLENDIKNITETKADGYTDDYRRCRLKAYRTKTRELKEYIEKEYFKKVEGK